MKLINTVYDSLPVWSQNLALGVYGRILRQRRYGGRHREYLDALLRSEQFNLDQIRSLQERLLRDTISKAVLSVPYYRSQYSSVLDRIPTTDSSKLLSAFEPLEKKTVRSITDDFYSRSELRNVKIQTSGSTGSPLIVETNRDAIQRNYAFFSRFLQGHGVSPRDESATFAGRLILPRATAAPPFWRRNAAMNDTLFSSYHLSDKNVPYYIAEMERLKPKFIDSYPSSIFRIADFICRNGIRHAIRPTVVITSSETLLDYQREVIERTFSCPVRDQYGNAEMAAFVAQCNHGSYHVAPEYGLIEILSESGDSLPAGESGQLCLTSFLNPAMPLIRYLIGDVGRMATSRCPCGRMTQILDGLEGRQDDTIVTPSGRNVGRLDPAFKGVTGVRMSQILQVSLDQVIVKIIADSTEAVDQARLVENLQERLGNDVHISFSFVSEIEKEPNGKFRSVKSLIR